MNSSIIKTLIYFIIIGVVITFLVSFYKNLISTDLESNLSEVKIQKTSNAILNSDININLLEGDKFRNLREIEKRENSFKSGKRNPFQPYE